MCRLENEGFSGRFPTQLECMCVNAYCADDLCASDAFRGAACSAEKSNGDGFTLNEGVSFTLRPFNCLICLLHRCHFGTICIKV